jgi:hypothetical protein
MGLLICIHLPSRSGHIRREGCHDKTMHFSQLPFFHFLSMKETKSEISSPKYAPTMESVEEPRRATHAPGSPRSEAMQTPSR